MHRVLVLVCAAGLAGCEHLIPNRPARPAELEQAGVRMGEGLLERAEWLDGSSLGEITSITDGGKRGVLVAGTTAAAYVNEGALSGRVGWPEPASRVQPVDVDGDGQTEFLDRGGHGWQTPSLLDSAGRQRFQPAREHGVDDMAAGHLDADGRMDFVVGYNGGTGVARYDADGREVWRQDDGNVWHVEIVDTDGDGASEIVHSNAGGQLTVRDASGRVLRRVDPPGSYFSQFALVRWPPSAPPRPVYADDGRLWVTDYIGGTAAELKAPGAIVLGDAHAVPVRLGAADHLAAVVDFGLWDRSALYVFDAGGTLAYHEVLTGKCGVLAALPSKSGPDDLLAGCGSRVWRYRPKATTR